MFAAPCSMELSSRSICHATSSVQRASSSSGGGCQPTGERAAARSLARPLSFPPPFHVSMGLCRCSPVAGRFSPSHRTWANCSRFQWFQRSPTALAKTEGHPAHPFPVAQPLAKLALKVAKPPTTPPARADTPGVRGKGTTEGANARRRLSPHLHALAARRLQRWLCASSSAWSGRSAPPRARSFGRRREPRPSPLHHGLPQPQINCWSAAIPRQKQAQSAKKATTQRQSSFSFGRSSAAISCLGP